MVTHSHTGELQTLWRLVLVDLWVMGGGIDPAMDCLCLKNRAIRMWCYAFDAFNWNGRCAIHPMHYETVFVLLNLLWSGDGRLYLCHWWLFVFSTMQSEDCLSVSEVTSKSTHDDVIKWKHFPRYWPFVRGIHRSQHKGQWLGALMFTLICARINGWVNNREAGDLRRYRAHYDVIVMRAN